MTRSAPLIFFIFPLIFFFPFSARGVGGVGGKHLDSSVYEILWPIQIYSTLLHTHSYGVG